MNGILVSQDIEQLIFNNWITSKNKILRSQVQPSSFDLSLGNKAYRVIGSCLPKLNESKEEFIKRVMHKEMDITKGLLIEKDAKYLIELNENIMLPPQLKARTNNKSSSGRLNLQTKLISSSGYDILKRGFNGYHFLEVTSRSFPVIVHEGDVLTQIRFYNEKSILSEVDLEILSNKRSFIFGNNGKPLKHNLSESGITLSLDINQKIIGFKAKKRTPIIDLKKNGHDYLDYFEPLTKNRDGTVTLFNGEFYILSTKEYLSVPTHLISEMLAFDLISGDFRSHFAGFIDPGFGFGCNGEVNGKPLTLEVIPNDDITLYDGQKICKIIFERTSKIPNKVYGVGREINSHYHMQTGPKLSKYFNNL